MDRRKFITMGGLMSVFPSSAAVAVSQGDRQPLARVEEGQILTAKMINDIVDRINSLDSQHG